MTIPPEPDDLTIPPTGGFSASTPATLTALRALTALVRAVVGWLCGFFEVRAQQSMTRLVSLLFAIVGAVIGVGAVLLVYRGKADAATLTALSTLATCFVAAGAVALLLRSKDIDGPSGGGGLPA